MKIDVHAHLYPQRYIEEIQSVTAGASDPWSRTVQKIVALKIASDPLMSDVERRLETMDEVGVDQQVLSLSIPHVYVDDPAKAAELAKLTNDLLAEIKADHPDRFRAVAVLPFPHVDEAVKEFARATDDLGLDGVTLGGNINGRPLDDPSFEPVFQAMGEHETLLVLHPMFPPGAEHLADYDLAPAVGFAMDTSAAVLRLIYGGVIERNPGMNVVVPHLGAYIPYVWDRIERSHQTRPEARVNVERPPTYYLSQMYYDSVNFHPPAWDCALRTVGVDHLVLGSDYPFALGGMDRAVETIDGLDLDADQKERIYSGNLLQLLP